MHQLISEIFNRTFLSAYNTRLEGGYDEPFYRAPQDPKAGVICFREDYVSSALHETAHWCIAGEQRRARDDFGYWYIPDGRTEKQQRDFENAEVKPQALEWVFSAALGVSFQISADNLLANQKPSEQFARKVHAQVQEYLRSGLPERALMFVDALVDQASGKRPVSSDFRLKGLGFENCL